MEKLARPFIAGAAGSKIIMTTWKLSLLTQLGYNQPYSLSVLSHDNAVSLFCQHTLGEVNFDSHPTLKPHGEGIIEKCDGLPLALRTLGRLLRTKTDEEEWKEVLNSEIWSLGKRDEIFPALRLSYSDLSSTLKLLFAYCSLFPKDYVFDKEELIQLWMAEGFLHRSTIGKSMQRSGLDGFEELLARSFFQHSPDNKSLFVMHDLMHDLATFVAGEFFSRLDIDMKKEIWKGGFKKYRHMSFVCETYMGNKRFEAFKGANNLRTFLAVSLDKDYWVAFYLSNKILDDLLPKLPLLRVLSLSQLTISKVPDFIGSLKHLRYLNLSQTKITHLPDNVCNLYNLQTLIVSGCQSLEKLPNRFSKLRNLHHFDMRDTPLLMKMPLGIGELRSLRTLPEIIIEGDNGFSITQLKDLRDLQGKISFTGLDKVQSPMHAHEANLSHRRVSELEMEWSDVFDSSRNETLEKEVLDVLKPQHGNLEKLVIVSYGGIEFPNWVGDPSFLWLAHVSIDGCKRCTSLPVLGQLPSLKELYIERMDGVKSVGLEFLGNGPSFPSLEILSFEKMKSWEEWSTNNTGVVDSAFPCLRELRLTNCPSLVKVSLEVLPSLRVLRINKCGHELLRSLVGVALSVTELYLVKISGLNDEAWRGVMGYLGAVQEVSIEWCHEIRYLWESEAKASKLLLNLRTLEVDYCKNLMGLGEIEEDNLGTNLTSLRLLNVTMCYNLEHCSVPNGVETLEIKSCSVTSLSFPTGGRQKINSLYIEDCEELFEEELGGGEKSELLINSSMPMLENISIRSWQNLKSITELSCFIHLTELIISNCPNMESFPDHELPTLTMLHRLVIKDCQGIEASFPRGLWPPKLSSLDIGGLKKSISQWGPQNFPTSLVDLRLIGGKLEDVRDFSQLSYLLPSSLTTLSIHKFDKLESLSMGLQHLTSLQHLSFHKCPKMMDLPKTLLPLLLSLTISKCPNLKERTRRRGYYGPLISHIPCIEYQISKEQLK